MKQTGQLDNRSMEIIRTYLHLPFESARPNAPYFNNRRSGLRGGLRALVGKGSPAEIVEEAKILALKKKVDLSKLNERNLKKFLVDHNLGVDCSAFISHVLGKEKLKNINFPYAGNFLKKLRCKIRPIENINVKTLAHDANSKIVQLTDIQPGDVIVMLGAGEKHDRDHILLIHEVQNDNNPKSKIPNALVGTGTCLKYYHSFQWRADDKYSHGVRQGTIHISEPGKPLLEQKWTEQGKSGTDNETLNHAILSKSLQLRHLL